MMNGHADIVDHDIFEQGCRPADSKPSFPLTPGQSWIIPTTRCQNPRVTRLAVVSQIPSLDSPRKAIIDIVM
jgi:hypothetical protein